MATHIFGTQAQRGKIVWGPDFQHQEDDEGLVTASHSFLCHTDQIYTLAPLRGSYCVEPGFGGLTRTGMSSQKLNGGISKVTCNYSLYRGTEQDYTTDDDGYSYQGGVITSQASLFDHPRYKDVSQAEKEIIVKATDGTYRKKAGGDGYTFLDSIDPEFDLDAEYEITSSEGRELYDKISSGQDTYFKPGQIVSFSWVSNSKPSGSLLGDVGKIYKGRGAPNVSGDRNWLLTGVPFTKSGGTYRITVELLLSEDGGWDEDLYDD